MSKKYRKPPKRKWLKLTDFYPVFDDRADYNTNAKSYYDWLARFKKLPKIIVEQINRLLRRQINVENTWSIMLTKDGDWIDLGGDNPCCCDNYTDEITLKANIILSKQLDTYSITIDGNTTTLNVTNGSVIYEDGLWSPDYKNVINKIVSELNSIYTRIKNIEKRVEVVEGDIINIKNEITNIYNLIDEIQNFLNQNFNKLTPGTDYRVTFYNGFSAQDLGITILETNFSISIRFDMGSSQPQYLSCSKCNDLELRHGATITDAPKSWIFGIVFLGDYAHINSFTPVSTSFLNTGNSIWNIQPTSARAKWNVECTISRNVSGQTLLAAANSIGDGYNLELTGYSGDPRTINDQSNNLNFHYGYEMAKRLDATTRSAFLHNVSRETIFEEV